MTIDECARIEELISATQDGAATPEEAARVERHVAGCARCQATVAAFRRVDGQVRRYLMATPVPELAAPWRDEPLLTPPSRGGGGGHWRVTVAGLAAIFVLLIGASILTFRPLAPAQDRAAPAQTGGSSAALAVAQTPTAGAETRAGGPTPALALAPAPAGAASVAPSTAPAASAAPAAGGAVAPSTQPRATSAVAAAASARPAAGSAPNVATSAAPAAAPPNVPPAPTPTPGARTSATAGAGVGDAATLNPAREYGLAGATGLNVCRPACDAPAQSADAARVVAALDTPLPRASGVPNSTVPLPYATLRFTFADGRQVDLGYYQQTNLLQLPDGRGLLVASPELVAALAPLVPAR